MLVLTLTGARWAILPSPFPARPPCARVPIAGWDWGLSKFPWGTLVYKVGKSLPFPLLVEWRKWLCSLEPLPQDDPSEPALPLVASTPTLCFLFADR